MRSSCRDCDPSGYLRKLVTVRVHSALKANKTQGSIEYLGCPIEKFRKHIEHQWTLPGNAGMTWDNHGSGDNKWQIDHIIPIKYPGADGAAPTLEEVAARLHWTNCQPMWALENIAKGNRFIGRERPPATVAVVIQLTNDEIDDLLGIITL
jgi:hypothetical protein